MSALGGDRLMTPTEAAPRMLRDPAHWLLHGGGSGGPALGGEAVVLLKNGDIWVGTLIRRGRRVVVRLAGSNLLWFATRQRVRRVNAVPAHTWAERQVILIRQRRGEPAGSIC